MRKTALIFAVIPSLIFASDDALNDLIKKLEEKGVLTSEEAKEIKKKSKFHPHLKVKIRLQPRIDAGDIYKENDDYKTKSDFYLRRVRLEVSRTWKKIPLGKKLKLNFTLKADKADRHYDFKKGKKSYHAPEAGVKYAYADWVIRDEFGIRFGIKKLPYSRVSLTSSSRQLLIERPFSTEDAKKWLGEYDNNHILFHGKIMKGVIRYMLAIGDGGSIEDENKTGGSVSADTEFGNLYAIRLEFSPPGFVEKKKDDTGIGEKNKGNVISVGVSFAKNSNFDVTKDSRTYKDEEGTVWGADIFGRFALGPGVLTAQAEYVHMEYDKLDMKEKGWYIQGGYLFDLANFGKLEPAFRYEHVKYDYKDKDKDIYTLGFNHYIKSHKVKWSYNAVLIDNEKEDDQVVHQIQAQFYF
ncbi:OprO/OprP family phosphate-selective porin [Aquifex pyrophilus]